VAIYSGPVSTSLRRDGAHHFRHQLADALVAAGPDAPTLCSGWSAADLAAHLYVRENKPLALLGIAGAGGRAANQLTESLMRQALRRYGFPGLISRFRAGPRPLTLWAFQPIDRLGNCLEFFVHLHDVTDAGQHSVAGHRAHSGHGQLGNDRGSHPGEPFHERLSDEIWQRLGMMAPLLAHANPVGIQLERLDGPRPARIVATSGVPIVTVRGSARQLALWAYGRPAEVQLVGLAEPTRAAQDAVAGR
jgi:uncharacterized protein (TIGR03085 family)